MDRNWAIAIVLIFVALIIFAVLVLGGRQQGDSTPTPAPTNNMPTVPAPQIPNSGGNGEF